MHENSQNTSTLIASVLLLSAFALSGCTGAVVGVGTAAVAASTTEKGFSTSVSDGVIFAKLKDRFIQVNASLLTSIDVTVNDGAVLFTGKVKTPEDKIKATKLAWEIMHRHALSRELTHLPVVHHRAKSVDLNLVPIKMFEGPLESGQRLLQ